MIESYIDIIHIKILCKRFLNTNLYSKLPFSQLASKLNTKKILHITHKLLTKLLNEYDNINVKKLLSCFMIKHHPNVIISTETDIEKNIIKLSDKVLNTIINIYESKNKFSLNFYISRFRMYYSIYIYNFDIWKERDKQKILNDLSTIYFELEHDKNKKYDDIDDVTNREFIISIEREQKKLVDKIESIGGKEGLEYINTLKEEIDKYKKNIENLYIRINQNLHNAYWDSIQEELSKIPPNFSVISHLLYETKELMINCDSTLENELNHNIDVPFIEDMFRNGVINDIYIKNMCNYIISIIQNIQSESNDKQLELLKTKINTDLDNGVYYKNFFPMFFKEVFERLEIILKDIDIMRIIRQNLDN